MSYSVSNLLRNMSIKNPVVAETKLYNPDIPDMDTVIRDRKFIRDQAYNSLNLRTGPRNGDGDLLPRNSFRPDNPKLDAFMMDRSIDPDVIRQRHNPTSMAQPVWNLEGLLYGVDDTMNVEKDSMDLVQKARNSYYNYTNRFNVTIPDSTIPSMTYDPNIPNIPNPKEPDMVLNADGTYSKITYPRQVRIADGTSKKPDMVLNADGTYSKIINPRQIMILNPDGTLSKTPPNNQNYKSGYEPTFSKPKGNIQDGTI